MTALKIQLSKNVSSELLHDSHCAALLWKKWEIIFAAVCSLTK
jgi:hypothetical protein